MNVCINIGGDGRELDVRDVTTGDLVGVFYTFAQVFDCVQRRNLTVVDRPSEWGTALFNPAPTQARIQSYEQTEVPCLGCGDLLFVGELTKEQLCWNCDF